MFYTVQLRKHLVRQTCKDITIAVCADSYDQCREVVFKEFPGYGINCIWYDWPQPQDTSLLGAVVKGKPVY